MSTVTIVLLVILVILIAALIGLYFFGKKAQKKQEEQQAQIEATKQTVSMLVIDKKRMPLKESGLPQMVIEQTPKLMRRSKLPIVKAKIGPKIAIMIADEKIFDLYKFRSMTDERDENGELLPDEVRLTEFGKVLRATSLDELPEAFNILKGDMSVIGPRPLLVKYLPRYSERQHRRHEVRPGLSGYAQVHGRNTVSWQDKFEMDVKYVDHITFLGDLKIIWDSVMAAFVRRDGISSEMSVTMEEFMGNGMVAK